jgi:mono/diheme cytochrome c family protein
MEWMSRLTQQWQRWWQRWGIPLLVMLFASGLLWIGSMATATAATVEDGKTLFEQSCASCHSLDGSGASYGPDLKTVTQRRDRNWLIRWIAAPEQVIESGDAIAKELLQQYNGVPMPNAGLQPDQVESIVRYLENTAGTVSAAPKPEETAAIATPATQATPDNLVGSNAEGDVVIGQKLFAGTIPFQKGGPACMSCHTVDVVGALRGGTLGPNLTHVIDRYTEVGLKGVLPTLPYPTMQGIYQNKLLTEEEQAHLLAFFKAANQAEVGSQTAAVESAQTSVTESFQLSSTWKFVLLGVGGFLLLALLSQITWRDRLTGVRQRLVEGHKS